jgi:exopolyphosphatase/guanosine-5'-triphosphate,3'-diphosphate pyrophosphatase
MKTPVKAPVKAPDIGQMTETVSAALPRQSPMAVIDIGSNSIRLVVYASQGRYPFPLFNERSNCRLGEGMDADGILRSERIEVALAALARFATIMKNMGVTKSYPVATAAVRRARNAEEFTIPASAILGQPIIILTQQEEAQHVARGVTLNVPNANGLIADLGGGSLEIVGVNDGAVTHATSLDIGHLSTVSKGEINAALAGVDWLDGYAPRRLYGVGGSFRALGTAYVAQTEYPLAVLHGLTIPRDEAKQMLAAFSREKPDLSGVPLGRQKTMPMAALIMNGLLRQCRAEKIFISGTSLRDGILAHNEFNAADRADFLQAVCIEISKASHRFADAPDALFQLLRPLYAPDDSIEDVNRPSRERFDRLLFAACLLSDLCWNEHEDIRANLGARRVIGLPVNCISHKERIWLSTAIFHRYAGRKMNKSRPAELGFIISRSRRAEAATIGLGLRFALMFSGGTADCLHHLKLTRASGSLILHVAPAGKTLLDSHARRRFQELAESAFLVPVIEGE